MIKEVHVDTASLSFPPTVILASPVPKKLISLAAFQRTSCSSNEVDSNSCYLRVFHTPLTASENILGACDCRFLCLASRTDSSTFHKAEPDHRPSSLIQFYIYSHCAFAREYSVQTARVQNGESAKGVFSHCVGTRRVPT